jgi:hypothetical protein
MRQPTTLPPYEPPSCHLSASALRALDEIRINHDYSKYNKHLDSSIKAVTNAAAECNDRLMYRKTEVQKYTEKRRNQGTEEEEKTVKEEEAQLYASQLKIRVGDVTTQAEKALRDLIDYRDELAVQDAIMREIGENIATAPAAQSSSRGQKRHRGDNGEEDENDNADEEDEAPAADPSILSAVELLKKGKEDYAATYASKSMLDR